jgi:uncharacterized Fe-S cluster-containing radical SAM superfamily protein
MKDLLNGYKQQAPFTVLIEPTEGCNLGCKFCGLRGMRETGTKPWNYMSLETAERIASEIQRVGWNCKIVFAQHGEPTLNPELFEIVQIFRQKLPNNIFHIYTNGWGMNRAKNVTEYVEKLFNAGINNIIVDCYKDNGDWNFVNKLADNSMLVLYSKGTPLYTNNHKRRILLLPPIEYDDENKMTRKLANHAGAAAPLDDSYNNKRCAMPFRELAFRYDGNVSLCCDDFRGQYPIANIYDIAIDELWNHTRFQAARIMLYNYSRDFRPCKGCTNTSVRVGFLPDSSGQDSLPEVTTEVIEIAQGVAENNPPLATIVKRPWEK